MDADDQNIRYDVTGRRAIAGASMNVEEKLMIAKQLRASAWISSRLGLRIVRRETSRRCGGSPWRSRPVVCSPCAGSSGRHYTSLGSLERSAKVRIHTFLSTSDIHLKHQFRMTREEAKKRAVEMVQLARTYVDDVEFSPMDASRSDPAYLCEVIEAVIAAVPERSIFPIRWGMPCRKSSAASSSELKTRYRTAARRSSLFIAITIWAWRWRIAWRQSWQEPGRSSAPINGIGERGGNTSLEEIVMGLRTRQDWYGADTKVVTEEIAKTSRLVSKITGMVIQPNKAIVGANAFAHTSGIHQDGLLRG